MMVLIVFLRLFENICCGYSLEVPHRGTCNEYLQHMFSSRKNKLSCGYLILSVGMFLHHNILCQSLQNCLGKSTECPLGIFWYKNNKTDAKMSVIILSGAML